MADEVTEFSDSSAFDAVEGISIPGFDEPTPPASNTQDAADQFEADAVAAADSSVSGETAETEKPVETAEQVAQAAAAKQFKFKMGDKEVPLDESAVIQHKIDGKLQPVAVKDLIENYAGKVAWDRKYNETAQLKKQAISEKEATEAELNRHRGLISDLHKKVGEGKTFEAVATLVQMTGLKVDPREYVKQLRDSLINQAQQMAQMTPADRAAYEFQEEREYFQQQQQTWKQQREAEQAKAAHEQRVASVLKSSGMTQDEFSETYSWLKSKVKETGGDPAQVTPEYVAQHKANLRAYETARDAIAAVEPELIENGIVKDESRWERIAALAKAHPEFSAEEFADMYREVRKSKQATAVSKKIAKAPVPTAATAAIRAKPAQRGDVDVLKAPFTEDDLRW